MSKAWAVIENDRICIRSVSETRRAAIVNWLCVSRFVMATNVATDAMIEKEWELQLTSRGMRPGDVVVEEVIVVRQGPLERAQRSPSAVSEGVDPK